MHINKLFILLECFCIINVEQNKPKERIGQHVKQHFTGFFCTTWARWHRIRWSLHVIVLIDFVFLYFKCYISTVGSLLPPPRPVFALPPLLRHPACDNTSGFAGSYCTQASPAGSLIQICCLHTSRQVLAYCLVLWPSLLRCHDTQAPGPKV